MSTPLSPNELLGAIQKVAPTDSDDGGALLHWVKDLLQTDMAKQVISRRTFTADHMSRLFDGAPVTAICDLCNYPIWPDLPHTCPE